MLTSASAASASDASGCHGGRGERFAERWQPHSHPPAMRSQNWMMGPIGSVCMPKKMVCHIPSIYPSHVSIYIPYDWIRKNGGKSAGKPYIYGKYIYIYGFLWIFPIDQSVETMSYECGACLNIDSCFHRWRYPKLDGLKWKLRLKWMMTGGLGVPPIWGNLHFTPEMFAGCWRPVLGGRRSGTSSYLGVI